MNERLQALGMKESFARRISGAFGPAGDKWLRRFPDLLEDLSSCWRISVGKPFPDMSYNYVAPAIRADGSPAVLKVGVPNRELFTEIEALRLYGGRGAVTLYDTWPEKGALLLEHLSPGVPLVQMADDRAATAVAAEVMARLRKTKFGSDSVPGDFPTAADWGRGFGRLRTAFDGGSGPFPAELVDRAEGLFEELVASTGSVALLHGDLHHWNILSAGREPWLAIDPKGVLGEPAYEVGAWLRNPFPAILAWPQPGKVIGRRVSQFSEALGYDRERLLGWGLAQAVLAAWWSYEGGDQDWPSWLAVAQIMTESA